MLYVIQSPSRGLLASDGMIHLNCDFQFYFYGEKEKKKLPLEYSSHQDDGDDD